MMTRNAHMMRQRGGAHRREGGTAYGTAYGTADNARGSRRESREPEDSE